MTSRQTVDKPQSDRPPAPVVTQQPPVQAGLGTSAAVAAAAGSTTPPPAGDHGAPPATVPAVDHATVQGGVASPPAVAAPRPADRAGVGAGVDLGAPAAVPAVAESGSLGSSSVPTATTAVAELVARITALSPSSASALPPELVAALGSIGPPLDLTAPRRLVATQELPPLQSPPPLFCAGCELRFQKPGNPPDENHCRCSTPQTVLPAPPRQEGSTTQADIVQDVVDGEQAVAAVDNMTVLGSDSDDLDTPTIGDDDEVELVPVDATKLTHEQRRDRWVELAPAMGGTKTQVTNQLTIPQARLVAKLHVGSVDAPPVGGKWSKGSEQSLSNLAMMCQVKLLEPGRSPKNWNRNRLYDFLMEHDGNVGSEVAPHPPAARRSNQFQNSTHGPRLVNVMKLLSAEIREMHKSKSRLEKDESAEARKITDTWTLIATHFLSDDYDSAVDELQDVMPGHLDQYDGQLRPHYKDRGLYLQDMSMHEAGQKLRSVFRLNVTGPIRTAVNNFHVSGNGDAHLNSSVTDSKAWGDMDDSERTAVLNTAGSSMLDSYLQGNWLIYAHRTLARNDLLTSLFSAMKSGSHGQGKAWCYEGDKVGNSSDSDSDSSDDPRPRSKRRHSSMSVSTKSPKKKKTKKTRIKDGHQAAILARADLIVAAANVQMPSVGSPTAGKADAARASLLENDLAKSHTTELMSTFAQLEGSEVTPGMKIVYGCRARKILVDMKDTTSADEVSQMKAELDRLLLPRLD